MAEENPIWRAPRAPASWPGIPLKDRSWEEVPGLPPLVRADDGGPAEQPTLVRVCWSESAPHLRFECVDRDAWGTYGWRDDPIYKEEAVEVFLAPGAPDPARYFEFEVSPRGVLFDAVITNPDGDRATMRTDPAWDCPGLRWEAGAGAADQDWWATLDIPWRSLLPETEPRPRTWRANFYRIERPRDGEPEFSAWSPTFTTPADFHQPARFGLLTLAKAPATASP